MTEIISLEEFEALPVYEKKERVKGKTDEFLEILKSSNSAVCLDDAAIEQGYKSRGPFMLMVGRLRKRHPEIQIREKDGKVFVGWVLTTISSLKSK